MNYMLYAVVKFSMLHDGYILLYKGHMTYSHFFWPEVGHCKYDGKSNEVYNSREDDYDVNGNDSAVGKLLPLSTIRETEVILKVETITAFDSGNCSISFIITTTASTSTNVSFICCFSKCRKETNTILITSGIMYASLTQMHIDEPTHLITLCR